MIKFAFSLFDQLMCAIPVHENKWGGEGVTLVNHANHIPILVLILLLTFSIKE